MMPLLPLYAAVCRFRCRYLFSLRATLPLTRRAVFHARCADYDDGLPLRCRRISPCCLHAATFVFLMPPDASISCRFDYFHCRCLRASCHCFAATCATFSRRCYIDDDVTFSPDDALRFSCAYDDYATCARCFRRRAMLVCRLMLMLLLR